MSGKEQGSQHSNFFVQRIIKRICLQLTLLFLLPVTTMLAPFTAQAKITLTFGTYTADISTEVVRQFRPILTVLEKSLQAKLGEPVHIKMQVTSTYDQGIENLTQGRVDFARFGPASYVFAKRKNPDIKLLAMENVKGKKTFQGIICVQKDSNIESLGQLKGKTMAFGSKRSTIGRYLAQLHLLESGIKSSDLLSYEYLGRHDKVGSAVGRKLFDAGALKESTFKKLVAKNVPIKAIFSFNNVTKPWIARAGLPERIVNSLQESLLEFTDSGALKRLKKSGFSIATPADYEIIEQAINRNEEFEG